MAITALTTKSLLEDQSLAHAIMSNSSEGSISPNMGGYITAKGTQISKGTFGIGWKDNKGRSYTPSWGGSTSTNGTTIARNNLGVYTSNTGATICSANKTSLTSSLGGRLCNNFATGGLNSNKKSMI